MTSAPKPGLITRDELAHCNPTLPYLLRWSLRTLLGLLTAKRLLIARTPQTSP